MRRVAVALVFALPFCASAGPVHVEYDAVVTRVDRTVREFDRTQNYSSDSLEFTRYSVGDRIHGFLTIDLTKAPPDRRPLEPPVGIYAAAHDTGGFINGLGKPLVHLTLNDMVSAHDRDADFPNEEAYLITDQWKSPSGVGQLGINLISRIGDIDLVHGDGIAQEIDVKPRRGLEMLGFLNKVVGDAKRSASGVKRSVSLHLGLLFNHVKVSVGSCKA